MVKLRRFGLRQYGPFEEFDVELGDITIFVGRNNTGKSTALEAAALLLSATNKFRDAYNRNIAQHVVAKRGNYIFKDGKGPEAHVWGNIDDTQLRLQIVREIEHLESKCRDSFLQHVESIRADLKDMLTKGKITQKDAEVVDDLIRYLVKTMF